MGVHTLVDPHEIEPITSRYGLGHCRNMIPLWDSGYLNSSYRLETDVGLYFLRIYEYLEKSGIKYEWQVLHYLGQRGASVPRLVASPPFTVDKVRGKSVAVFHLIEGAHIGPEKATESQMHKLGATLAGAHCATAGFPKKRPLGSHLGQLLDFPSDAAIADNPHLIPWVKDLRSRAANLIKTRLTGLPVGVTHGDLTSDNVFWDRHDRPVLLDWEFSGHGPFIDDLGLLVLAWTFRNAFNWTKARALVSGYNEVRPLTVMEWEGLHHAVCCAATRMALMRIFFIQMKLKHPQDPPYRDFKRYLDRLEILDQMTPSHLLDLLRRGT